MTTLAIFPPKKRNKRRKPARRPARQITLTTVCNLSELASFTGISRRTIYDHTRQEVDPYQLQYPRIGKTTPAHYLDWASKAPVIEPEEPAAALQREHEKCRLRSSAGKSRAQTNSRD